MKPTLAFFERPLELRPNSAKKFPATKNTSQKVAGPGSELIRFEERKEIYIWVEHKEILFVKSADHYVKSLIQHGNQKKWVIRHCSIKDMLAILTHKDFVRLNKFYIINRNHLSYINEIEKILYLDDGFPIPVPHRISHFIIDMLKD